MRDPLFDASVVSLVLLLIVPELLGYRVWDVLAVECGFEDFTSRDAWSIAEYKMHGMELMMDN